MPKAKPKDVLSVPTGGKQTTLFGLKKGMAPRIPSPIPRDSFASTETDGEMEETLGDETYQDESLSFGDETRSGVLEESLVSGSARTTCRR